jgi:hypothetical protein
MAPEREAFVAKGLWPNQFKQNDIAQLQKLSFREFYSRYAGDQVPDTPGVYAIVVDGIVRYIGKGRNAGIYSHLIEANRSSARRSRRMSANAEIQQALIPMRDRARELVRNTPHAPRLIDVFTASIVVGGIRPVPNTGSDRLNDRVEELRKEWQAQVDVQGVHSFYSMQVLAIRSMIESGEVVLRFIDRNPKDVESEVPLQLQLLESDFIDSYRDGIYGMEGGGNTGIRPAYSPALPMKACEPIQSNRPCVQVASA